MGSFGRSLGRAAVHSASAAIVLLVVLWVARALGASDLLAVGLGVVVALAPGAYDYLGRDLMGRRLVDDDPLEEHPYLWVGKTRLTRSLDDGLNASDFAFVARELASDWTYLKPMVEDLNLASWRALDPESELAEAVMTSVEAKIDGTVDWAVEKKLPLVGLFWADIHAMLTSELARDFAPDPVAAPKSVQ